MVPLLDLWLPILVATVFVFVASSVMHMALPIHKKDFVKLPDEEKVLEALRAHGVGPGQYMFPCASSMKDMGSPEMRAKFERGPIGTMIVRSLANFSVGKSLVQWCLFSLVVSACTAYVAGLCFAPGADARLLFRVTSTVALLGYGLSHAVDSIWKGLSWGVTFRFVFDGLVYALGSAATFVWLWPGAAAH